jgi:peroxiredoxin
LPRFEGPLLGGGRAGTEQLQGRRAIVHFFTPADPDAQRVAAIVARVAPDAGSANVAILGIAAGVSSAQAVEFAARQRLSYPVIVDSDLEIARKLRLTPGRSALLVVDAQGYIIGGFAGLQVEQPAHDAVYESQLREALYLSRPGEALAPELGVLPAAPAFKLTGLDKSALSSTELAGKVVVLMFFSPTCPHCHEALRFFKALRAQLAGQPLVIAPVSVSDRVFVIEQMVSDLALDFPVYLDPGGAVARAYAHQLGVPDTVVIDRQGRVVARHGGIESRLKALLAMEIRAALGVANPILLEREGYSGEEFCQVCHRQPHATWSLTRHAYAFETLAEHGQDHNPECLPCHTVGWGQKGGYSLENRAEHLRGVQCENCHGRGGPHQSPEFAAAAGYQPICETCHTPEHSLRFDFAERLPLVSHAANQQFAALSLEERLALLQRRDQRERQLFERADYVGSESCRGCHAGEHAQWSRSAHARALVSLEPRGEQANAQCQRCHTTGFGEPGGWPAAGAPPDAHPALAGVGCESCHGPGGKHVAAGSAKRGTILRLADKCDSCVLLQICGSCHDDANDPGFEFELMDKLEHVRHGTTPAPEGST